MARRSKKGQTAGEAAAFISIIAGFMLLYILLMPPDERQALLDGTTTTSTAPEGGSTLSPGIINKTVFSASPGRISYLRYDEFDHPLPAINLYTTTNAQQMLIGDSLYIKNGVFDKQDQSIDFELPDPSQVKNVFLTFSLNQNRNNKGRLIIWLNEQQIFERELSGQSIIQPIVLPQRNLQKQNTLRFSVSSVGWQFWTTNDYELDNIKVIYDYTDLSKQSSRNSFMVGDAEKFNLEKAVFKFNPDCNPREIGKLTAKINNHIVYDSVPDCGQLNIVDVSASFIEAGNNYVNFQTEQGYYLIDHIMVQTKMKQMSFPTYYFDLDKRLFNIYEEDDEDEECGEIDGVCPVDCPEYMDKDCCLQKTSKYWCDVKTNNINERCRSVAYENDCQYCPSGYEDRQGNPPEVCEDMCGDDTDNHCPEGCNKFYDKDCCFEDSETNYWCDEVPKYGLSMVCRAGIHIEDCADCESGYETEEGTLDCPDITDDRDEETILRNEYDVWLKFRFLDDGERKAARVFVNGYQFYMDTTKDSYDKNIDNYIEDGSNAVKIEPNVGALDIIEIEVEIERAR